MTASPRLDWPGRGSAEAETARCQEQARSKRDDRAKNLETFCGDLDRSPQQGSQHRIICADNLVALQQLLSDPSEFFHLIYIDPPYNTGQDFMFSDKRGKGSDASSAWLSFMLPRLTLARDLLTEDGLICVSIDDHEQASLTMLMRELFGQSNHIMTIKWRRKRKPSFLAKHVSPVFEYVVLFARNANKLPRLLGQKTTEDSRPVLNHGNAPVERILRAGTPAFLPNGAAAQPGTITVRSLSYSLLDPLRIEDGKVVEACRVLGPFRVSQEILDRSVYVTKTWGLRRRIDETEQKRRHASDDGSDWATNEDADQEIQQRFGRRAFSFAKPVGMLRKLVTMYPAVSHLDQRPIRCLDFFAGTGSFGEAVCQENDADGQQRSVTLIQSDEPLRNTQTPLLLEPARTSWLSIFDLMSHRMTTGCPAVHFERLDWRTPMVALHDLPTDVGSLSHSDEPHPSY